MKLEDIDDVLKQNASKDCSVRWLAALILHCDDYSKLYESCRNYDEFEKRVLNKECCLNDIYSAISMYGKDRKNHWYRIRELFGNRCFKTTSDVGSLLVGDEEFQVLIPNGYGDGTTRVAVFNKADSDFDVNSDYDVAFRIMPDMMNSGPYLYGEFNIYPYDCCNPTVDEPFDTLFPNMDSNKIYGIEKDAEGNHLLMKYEIRECGVWPNYFKVLDDGKNDGTLHE